MAIEPIKLYIGNLCKDITDEAKLTDLFTKNDFAVENVTLKKGFGFVDVPDEDIAKKACEALNGKDYSGSVLVVERSDPKTRQRNNLTNKIRVSNVPVGSDREQIVHLLDDLAITDFKQVNRNDTAQIVELTFDKTEEATQAFSKLHEKELHSMKLRCNYQYDGPRRYTKGGRYNTQYRSGSYGPSDSPTFPLRVLVPADMVGAIIGKSGVTISQITKDSKAKIDVNRQESYAHALEKPVTITGTERAMNDALKKIYEVMAKEAKEKGKTDYRDLELKMLAHNTLVGRLIGKDGNNIKRIMNDCASRVSISSQTDLNSYNMERTVTVKAENSDSLFQAQDEIFKKLKDSFEKDMSYIITACEPDSAMMPPPSYQPIYPRGPRPRYSQRGGGSYHYGGPPDRYMAPGPHAYHPRFPFNNYNMGFFEYQ